MGVCHAKSSKPELDHKKVDTGQSDHEGSADRESSVKSDKGTMETDKSSKNPLKLLLLGSGESGKSTFFKRMQSRYGRGFEEDDRMEFKESIFDNILDSMKTLLYQSKNLDIAECLLSDHLKTEDELISNLVETEPLTKAIAISIQKLWSDSGIKKTFSLRYMFQVPDSAEYFFEDVNRISRKGYIPTEQDILMCRDRTTGVTRESLMYKKENDKIIFDIYDVGGQRSERKAWEKIFTNVNGILFVVAISEFDQCCFEDETTNRLYESLSVFTMIANSRHFENTPIVLLFNKMDLFVEKLNNGIEFKFEDYDGAQDRDSITEFIQELFEDQNKTSKAILTQFVCAIGPEFDLDSVLTTIVNENENEIQ